MMTKTDAENMPTALSNDCAQGKRSTATQGNRHAKHAQVASGMRYYTAPSLATSPQALPMRRVWSRKGASHVRIDTLTRLEANFASLLYSSLSQACSLSAAVLGFVGGNGLGGML